MKKIKVLFFGALSEIAGKQEEEIALEGKLDDLLSIIKEKYPATSDINFNVAINQEVNASKKDLSEGDEVALLPPFTGG